MPVYNDLPVTELPLMMTVGGSFDAYAGAVPRPPRWMLRFRLEWLYRLVKQPFRAPRMLALPRFACRVLRLRYAPTERLELGLELPYLGHSEGRLDALIDTWHDLFGLPGGDRETRDNDLLEFRYADASGQRLNFVDSASGIGDLRLSAGWRLGDDAEHRRALRFAVTLPTGEATDLHGLDAVTLGVGYAGDMTNVTADGKLSLFYRFHATWVEEPALLPDSYNEWIGHLAGGFGYAATDWLELRAQVLARTATHDSDLAVLGEPSVILSFGEDIKVGSSPDVSFQLALRYRPAD